MAVESRKRAQLNISLANGSPLAGKLREAEQVTGQSRSEIVRAVLDTFLGPWLQVEQARQHLVDAVKAAATSEGVVAISIHDLGPLRPPHRGDQYQPAPDLWRAVEARRPIPPQLVQRFTDVPVTDAAPHRPRVRLAEPTISVTEDEDDPGA